MFFSVEFQQALQMCCDNHDNEDHYSTYKACANRKETKQNREMLMYFIIFLCFEIFSGRSAPKADFLAKTRQVAICDINSNGEESFHELLLICLSFLYVKAVKHKTATSSVNKSEDNN